MHRKAQSGTGKRSAAQLVTPEDGVNSRLESITFESFIPAKFKSIAEEKGEDSGSSSSIQLEPFGVGTKGTQQAVRRLQFSEAGTSGHPTPTEKSDYEGNRNVKQGKALYYIPPSSKDGKVYVTIEKVDLKEQEIYWKTALIGYVIGDTPFVKTVGNFVLNTWNFVYSMRMDTMFFGSKLLRIARRFCKLGPILSSTNLLYYKNGVLILSLTRTG